MNTATQNAVDVKSIGIGEYYVAAAPERIRTVLGSCIGIALFDRKAKLGALAHIILPSSAEGSGARGKFADTAIDDMVQQLLEKGALKHRITAKLAGGARMFGTGSQSDLGQRNADAAIAALKKHGIATLATDLGGTSGRKVTFWTTEGIYEVQIIGQKPRTI
ncbi:MAG: chemotaxis protein CheD [Phycisphaerae bacterium]